MSGMYRAAANIALACFSKLAEFSKKKIEAAKREELPFPQF